MTPDESRILATFRARYEYDRGLSRLRPVAHYQRIFAGFEDAVAREYARLEAEHLRAAETAVRPPTLPAPPRESHVGPYRILGELGRGGQAVVYVAEDARLQRKVALKVFAPGLMASEALLARFRREAEAASRLDHPGICTVYEAGVDDGTPYIAMRYVEGTTLAQRIDASAASRSGATSSVELPATDAGGAAGRTTDVPRIVALVEKTARALHAAHEAGLVHRDVKPGNIMVTKDGEPVLLDFGLARGDDHGHTLTATGTLLGTPAYMSPEQIAAQRIQVDRRTDVYSLGVTLYECLTLRRPFDAPTREGLYKQILVTEPADARRLNPSIPRDLWVATETAMAKDRDRRYQTAADFAEDLRRVRAGEPIRARPVGPAGRLVRWARRNPALAGSLCALLAALSAGLVVSLALLGDARTERDAKDLARRQAVAALAQSERERTAKESALERAEALRLTAQSTAVLPRSPTLALLLAMEGAARLPGSVANDALITALDACNEERTISGHDGDVTGACFTPDGNRIVTTSEDGTARVWDATDGRQLLTIDAGEPIVSRPRVTPDASRLAALDASGVLHVWDLATGREVGRTDGFAPEDRVGGFPMSADGTKVAVVRADGTPCVVSVADGIRQALGTARERWPGGRAVAFSPDGRWLLVSTPGNTACPAQVWDLSDGALRWTAPEGTWTFSEQPFRLDPAGPRLLASRVYGARGESTRCGEVDVLTGDFAEFPDEDAWRGAWATDGRTLATARAFGRAAVAAIGPGAAAIPLVGHENHLAGVRFSPDGTRVLTFGADGSARTWDARTGRPLAVFRDHRTVRQAEWSPDGSRIVTTGGDDEAVRVWRADGRGALPVLAVDERNTTGVVWSPDSRHVAVVSRDVSLFEAETGRRVASCAASSEWVLAAAFSPSGDILVTTLAGRETAAWSVPDLRPLWRLAAAQYTPFLQFDRDGRRALAGVGPDLVVVRLRDGFVERRIPIADLPPLGPVLLTADGSGVVAVGRSGEVRRYDVGGGERRLAALGPHTYGMPAPACDGFLLRSGGSWALYASADMSVRCRFEEPGGFGIVSADGRRVTGSADGWVTCDTSTGRLVGRALNLVGGVAAVGPDARLLAIAGNESTVYVHDVETSALVMTLRGHSARVVAVAFSPDGSRVATGARDGTARVWPIDALGAARRAVPRELTADERRNLVEAAEPAREPAATVSSVLQQIATEAATPAEARAAIRAREDLDASARRALERLVRHWPTHASALNEAAWRAVVSGAEPHYARIAVRQAEAAVRMSPGDLSVRNTLGGALCRAGEHARVVSTLTWTAPPRDDAERAVRAYDLTFLAMAHSALGRPADARAAIDELASLRADERLAADADLARLAAEAAEAVAAGATGDAGAGGDAPR